MPGSARADEPDDAPNVVLEDARAFQHAILPKVSRTFALTIPQLPRRLAEVVANAYLLCRIADTVEDDPCLSASEKHAYSQRFVAVVAGEADPGRFAADLAAELAPAVCAAERELVAHTPAVVHLTHAYRAGERDALVRCVRIMAAGMAEYQLAASPAGLADQRAMDRYCYHVAGVVGEMLTALFCEHSAAVARRREALSALSVSFGQGLQMTNILKDVWDDFDRGACWLPRAEFAAHGFDLDALGVLRDGQGQAEVERAFRAGLDALVAVAHGHLGTALEYTLLVPSGEPGIRRFCLWALGMAMLTLRRVHRGLGHWAASDVKIPRASVRATIVATNLALAHDNALRAMFRLAGRGLPAPVMDSGR